MYYKNSVCDGCGAAFTDDDDIVVCPECGTPQHRDCYKQNNRCVNEYKHGNGFEWNKKSGVKPASHNAPDISNTEKLPCPSCGHLNSRDARVCENCSMKLIVFGMNLAEAAKETRPDEQPMQNPPSYMPPFTIGQGEGFSHVNGTATQPPQEQPVTEEQIRQNRENAKQHLLFRFVGSSAGKYMSAFRKLEFGRAFTFNWAAFFFAPYWFFYRKLYKAGAVFLTASLIVSTVFSPTITKFYDTYITYGADLYAEEAVMNAFFQEMGPLFPVLYAFFIANLAINLLAGLVAYPLYKKHADKAVERIMSSPSPDMGLSLVSRLGGTSFFSVVICYFVTSLITSLTDFIIYAL